jgi:hypothetical protein
LTGNPQGFGSTSGSTFSGLKSAKRVKMPGNLSSANPVRTWLLGDLKHHPDPRSPLSTDNVVAIGSMSGLAENRAVVRPSWKTWSWMKTVGKARYPRPAHRKHLTIRVKCRLNVTNAIDAPTDLFILRGPPAFVCSDNGPECVAKDVWA